MLWEPLNKSGRHKNNIALIKRLVFEIKYEGKYCKTKIKYRNATTVQ